ncbi:MAG: hypothetical protein ACXAE3_12785 [Candidatus Kariarchaeaceae archaeon]|jgi:hypothetical protein
MTNREVLENRLKQLEEILDLQVELGEDTAIVMEKIREVEVLLKEKS